MYSTRMRKRKREENKENSTHEREVKRQKTLRKAVDAGTKRNVVITLRKKLADSKEKDIHSWNQALKTFQKEKTHLEAGWKYHTYTHFNKFPGHSQLRKPPNIAGGLQRKKRKLNENEDIGADKLDLDDPEICSRYRLGIAPVFGEDLIFETPLASLAMSQARVPESLPEIEELERQKTMVEAQLRELQETVGRKLDKCPEPSRTKTKWDFMLDEMKLMSEDFVREAKWKKDQAKKLSKAVLKHFAKEETKRKNKAKTDKLKMKKMSSKITKEVAQFWKKVGKIVEYGRDLDQRLIDQKERNEKLEQLVESTEQHASEIVQEMVIKNESQPLVRDQVSHVSRKLSDVVARSKIHTTNQTKTKIPHLLRFGTLRDYQHVGLDWLAALQRNGTNGILADEMGLGKTIQTIAALAHLACEKEIWGPHLIVVPASVIMNWEMEFKRWLPGFKVISYHGTKEQRKVKRQGWGRQNAFHVCITSYNLVVREATVFRRKKWQYLVLDEAHQIKNYNSQRWQTMLRFNTQHRLLLTGTPLQNNLNELWSLLHFLMPKVFESQSEFNEWFNNPVNGMVARNQELANSSIIQRLHSVLKPFLLRRLKKEVEKQLPQKHFHTIKCRLSRRQRRLYEDFMAQKKTQETMARNDYMGMMNIVMQLRKVCNHPDLFEGRAIRSPFTMQPLTYSVPSLVVCDTIDDKVESCSTPLKLSRLKGLSKWDCEKTRQLRTSNNVITKIPNIPLQDCAFPGFLAKVQSDLKKERKRTRESLARINNLRMLENGLELSDIVQAVKIRRLNSEPHVIAREKHLLVENLDSYPSSALKGLIKLPHNREEEMRETICKFIEYNPPVTTKTMELHAHTVPLSDWKRQQRKAKRICQKLFKPCQILHRTHIRRKMIFPDLRLIQWDCGKLQALDRLLRERKEGGHRCLIFTQMSKMLNVLESFLNLYHYRYLRLDGTTKTEDRGKLMHKFNQDDSIFCFILSTRSGGLGMNLTGADTVIFYDNDWNPAMDLQAQDRCHRIGQTREVHIYKLCSENTIEENILKKAAQKLQIMSAVMGEGAFTMDVFKNLDPWELLGLETKQKLSNEQVQKAMAMAEDREDREAASMVYKEQEIDPMEMVTDEEREKAKYNTTVELLNPIEKYCFHFFGKDHRPHPVIDSTPEHQCRRLDNVISNSEKYQEKVENQLSFYRDLKYVIRKGEESASNTNTEKIEAPKIKTITGVHFEEVLRMSEINFKEKAGLFLPSPHPEGFETGKVTHLVPDDNCRDWGLFATQKEIDMMIPRKRTFKRKRVGRSQDGGIVKRIKKEQYVDMMIRMDSQMVIHVPWSCIPHKKRPTATKQIRAERHNSSRADSNLAPDNNKLRPPRKARNRPSKDVTVPFSLAEEAWLKKEFKTGASARVIALKMSFQRQFEHKHRNNPEVIKKKFAELKNSSSTRKKKQTSLDIGSRETLQATLEDQEKLREFESQIEKKYEKNDHCFGEKAYQKIIEKARRSMGGSSRGFCSPKDLITSLMQEEFRRSQMRHSAAVRQNFNNVYTANVMRARYASARAGMQRPIRF